MAFSYLRRNALLKVEGRLFKTKGLESGFRRFAQCLSFSCPNRKASFEELQIEQFAFINTIEAFF